MKTRQRTGMSLVLEFLAYTTLTVLHLWGGAAAALPYTFLNVATFLTACQLFFTLL